MASDLSGMVASGTVLVDPDVLEKYGTLPVSIAGKGYIVFNLTRRYLHIVVAGAAPKGMEVDHKNRNKLDCSRENLRHITISRNRRNRESTGVYFDTRQQKFVAEITLEGRGCYLGSFDSEEKAKQVYAETKELYA